LSYTLSFWWLKMTAASARQSSLVIVIRNNLYFPWTLLPQRQPCLRSSSWCLMLRNCETIYLIIWVKEPEASDHFMWHSKWRRIRLHRQWFPSSSCSLLLSSVSVDEVDEHVSHGQWRRQRINLTTKTIERPNKKEKLWQKFHILPRLSFVTKKITNRRFKTKTVKKWQRNYGSE
jgi:hypothetical protein